MAYPKEELFNIEDFKATGDIAYPAILRFNILQIISAKAKLDNEAYLSLIDLLETLLFPYSDGVYTTALAAIKDTKDDITASTHPKDRARSSQDLEYEAYEAKFKILVQLMARKHLLLEEETAGYQDSASNERERK